MRTWNGRLLAVCLCAIAGQGWVEASHEGAGEKCGADPKPPTIYKSPHFVLHTDLSPREAELTLARMEASLKFAAAYWRRKPRGRIDCYVVDDLLNWSDESLPHSLARVWVGGVGGPTMGEFVGTGKATRARATIYASSRRGVVEHEVIHAYCCQTFGATGPDWYKEGMAEAAVYGAESVTALWCPAELVEVLKQQKAKTVREIVGGDQTGQRINQSLDMMLANREDRSRHVSLNDWTEQDHQNVLDARQSYVWSWALCHMLMHNPNYAIRFRTLGNGYLTNRKDSFERMFLAMHDQLAFEYAFFLERVDVGYRVDLCSWDWHKRFRTLERIRSIDTRVLAAQGYQASGLAIAKGWRYGFSTKGSWATSAGGGETGADGGDGGAGKLVGVVMNDYRLGEPFELGAGGTFVAPSNGYLYMRCRDAWNQLGDNRGQVQVRFTRR